MQQQQSASYDLLAVFPDETRADSATAKLHKEGFSDEEVHQLSAGSIGSGQFREHGPNRARRELFLQTQHTGLGPAAVILLVIIFGLLGAGLTFVATFALPQVHTHTITVFLIGAAIGIVLGIIIGLLQRARVRGNIGQKVQNQATAPPNHGARTVVALRFADPDNISRKSRARAILLNNQGKIDRSVGRQE
jgi:hypothetical protein